MLKCKDLLIEYRENPINIDETRPAFSWKTESDKENVMQASYRIIVDDMWDSGYIQSEKSLHIEYDGKPLQPKSRYNVKVRVTDNYGQESDWAEGYFETTFLGENLWSAKWLEVDNSIVPVAVFKKSFTADDAVTSARLYATAYGTYDVRINGKKAIDSYLNPGFTSYKKRLQYQTFDISEHIKPGENIIELYLAKGWCTGRYPFQNQSNTFELNPAILAQIELRKAGETKTIATDDSWECFESKLRFCELYDGEIYDNSLKELVPLDYRLVNHGYDNLIGQVSEHVKLTQTVNPVKIIKTPANETVIDFGQNLAGFVEFTVEGNYKDVVEFSHAEVLDKNGNFYTENLRTAKQKITYILSGGKETYHSAMTFQGFRYIRIDRYPGEVRLENFKAHVIHTDMKRTGHFNSSHLKLNQLFKNCIWSQRGNFIDIPTDCPQRDERVAWTGDAQVFCKTAAQNMNTALFYKKWLGDVIADQTDEGACLIFVPSMKEFQTAAGWGDAAVIVPWEIYNAYGDVRVLETQYDSMKKWIEYIKAQGDNPYLWNTGLQFGDWLALDGMLGRSEGGTSPDLVATAYYAYSTSLIIKIAEILGYKEDVKYFSEIYQKIIENFTMEFITPNGRVCDNTQSAQTITLAFNLTENKEKTAARLNTLVKQNNYKLSTGFLGTPFLCDVLFDNGYKDAAFNVLLQEEYPSWLYSVNAGATTIWEHWDGIKPDGSFWSNDMNSYNHYAYGAIVDFLYKRIGGIYPAAPGYKNIVIKPYCDSRISCANTELTTFYGKIVTNWETSNGTMHLDVTVPCNTKATIELPDGTITEVGSGSYSFESVL